MAGVKDYVGRRRNSAFDPRLVRESASSERGKTQARQSLRRLTQSLAREVRNFQAANVGDYAVFASELEADYIEAVRLYNEFLQINARDPVLTDLDRYIKEVKKHLKTVLKGAASKVKNEIGLNNEFTHFAKVAESTVNFPRRVAKGTRRQALNHTPTGAGTVQRLFQRQMTTAQRQNSQVSRQSMTASSFGVFSAGGPAHGMGRPSQMNAFERATLNMNRQIMKRDQEFQEWQQDFWTKFGRQFGGAGAKGAQNKNGLDLSDLILGALGLKKMGKWLKGGLAGIGDLLKGFGRRMRRLVGPALGLGAIFNMDEIGKFISDFNTKFTERWNGLVDGISSRLDGMKTRLGERFAAVQDQFAKSMDSLGEALRQKVANLSDGFGTMKTTMVNGLNSLTDSMGTAFDAARAKVTDFTTGVASTLDDWNSKIGNTFEAVNSKVTDYAGRLATAFDNAGSMISNSATKLIDNIAGLDLPGRISTNILDPTLATFETWGTKIGNIIGAIPSQIDSALKSASELTSRAASSLGQGANYVGSALKSGATTLWDGAKTVGNVAGDALAPVGKFLGKAGKVAGPAGDIIGGVAGAVNVQDNYGLINKPTARDRVGGAAGGFVSSGIPDIYGWATGNEFRPGTEERALRGLWENWTNGDQAKKAETVAAALLRGDRVSASDLGTDDGFLEMVIRRINDVADHNRKNVSRDSWFGGGGSLNAMATPQELAFLASGLGSEFLMNDPEGFSAFVKANNYAASQAESAVRNYAQALKDGKSPAQVRRLHGDMRALVTAVQTEFNGYKPSTSSVDDILKRGAEIQTQYSTGGVLSKPVLGFTGAAPMGQDGGQKITIAETSPEAVFPLVRDPVSGNLGVETHTIAPQGPVNLKTEEFGIMFDGDSGRDFAFGLIEAIKKYLPNESGESGAEDRGGTGTVNSETPVGRGDGPATADVANRGRNANFIDHQAREKEDTALNNEIGAADADIARLTNQLNSGNLSGSMENRVLQQLEAAKSRRSALSAKQQRISARRKAEDNVASSIAGGRAATADISSLGQLPGTATTASSALADGDHLGKLSSTYEGKVNSANRDNVGHAYGKYQFNDEKGGLAQFFKSNPAYAAQFSGLRSGTDEFAKKWREVAASDPKGFEAAQDRAAADLWYKPAGDYGKTLGFKTDDRGVQESIFSGSIQHGKIKKLLKRVADANPGFADMSPADQVKAFYAERRKYAAENVDAGTMASLTKRYAAEEQNALTNYVGKAGVNLGSGIDVKAATVADMQKIDAEIGAQLNGGRLSDAYRQQLMTQREGLRTKMTDLQSAEKKSQTVAGDPSNPATTAGKALRISMAADAWAKVDPRMQKIAEEMSLRSENGIEVFSGFRGANESNHNGQAFDFNVLDKDGKAIPQPYLSKGGKGNFPGATENFRAYEKAAQIGRLVQLKNFPELTDRFRTGAYFGGKMGQQYGANDSMHLDITKKAGGAMGAGDWVNGLNSNYRGVFDKNSDPSKGLGDLATQQAMAARLDELYPISKPGTATVDVKRAAELDAAAMAEYRRDMRSSSLLHSYYEKQDKAAAEAGESMQARLPSRFEMNSISHVEDRDGATAPTFEPPARQTPQAADQSQKQASTNMTTGNNGQQVAAVPSIDSIRNRSYDPEQIALLSNGLRTV